MDMDGDGRDEVVAQTTYGFSVIHVLSHLADASFADDRVDLASPGDDVNLGVGSGAARFARSGAAGLFGLTGFAARVLLPQNGASYHRTAEIHGGFAVADVDGDGLSDVIADSGRDTDQASIEAHLSRGDGTFHGAGALHVPAGFDYVGVGDVDGDHHVDLVTFYWTSPHAFLALFKGHGDGTFEGPVPFTAASDWSAWQHASSGGAWLTGDFDGDGRLDVVVPSTSGGIVVIRGACTVQ
jgi:hypothetical protein